MRASAKRPLVNSLCARSNAASAADSSCVGGRGGGAAGVDLTARTAASLCVFLTLDAVAFLAVAFDVVVFVAAFRATDFAGDFFALAGALDFAAVFFAALAFARLRAGAFAVTARLALGFDGDLALTARFVVFAEAVLTFERDADRLIAFEVRLLLMGGISKGCSPLASSRGIARRIPYKPL